MARSLAISFDLSRNWLQALLAGAALVLAFVVGVFFLGLVLPNPTNPLQVARFTLMGVGLPAGAIAAVLYMVLRSG